MMCLLVNVKFFQKKFFQDPAAKCTRFKVQILRDPRKGGGGPVKKTPFKTGADEDDKDKYLLHSKTFKDNISS